MMKKLKKLGRDSIQVAREKKESKKLYKESFSFLNFVREDKPESTYFTNIQLFAKNQDSDDNSLNSEND